MPFFLWEKHFYLVIIAFKTVCYLKKVQLENATSTIIKPFLNALSELDRWILI